MLLIPDIVFADMSFPLAPSQLRGGDPPLAGGSPWRTATSGVLPYPGQTQLGPTSYPTKYPLVGEARASGDMNLLSNGRTPLVVAVKITTVSPSLASPSGTRIARGRLVIVAQLKENSDNSNMALLDPVTTNWDGSLYRGFAYYALIASAAELDSPTTVGSMIQTRRTVISISVANTDMMQLPTQTSLTLGQSITVDPVKCQPAFSASVLTMPMGPSASQSAQVYFSFQPCYLVDANPTLLHSQPVASSMVDTAPGEVGANYVNVANSLAKLGAVAATKLNASPMPLGPHASTDANPSPGFTRITSEHIEAESNSLAAALLFSHNNTGKQCETQLKMRSELVLNKSVPKEAGANKHLGAPLTKYVAHPGIFNCELGTYGKNPCVWQNASHGAEFAEKYSQIVRHAFAKRKAFDVDRCDELIAHLATPKA